MAVGLKTLLEAAQYIEEQEQQQKSPLSAYVSANNHHHHQLHHLQHQLNSSNLINESNNNNNNNNNNNAASCFIAHYSLAVSSPKTSITPGIITTTTATSSSSNSTTIGAAAAAGTRKFDENHKISLSPVAVEGYLANGHHHQNILNSHNQQHAVATDTDSNMLNTKKALFSTAMTCQPIMQNLNINNGATTSVPASITLQQHVAAIGNGFSITAKTKTPTEFLLNCKKDNVIELNNNNNDKGQLLTGTIIQQHVNPNNQHHLPTSVNTVNVATTNVAATFINNSNSISSSSNNNSSSNINNKLNNNINNNGKDDFDTSNILLSPAAPATTGRARSASASTSTRNNIFVLGIVDPGKTINTSNQTNFSQTNVNNNATDSKGLQMMIVNEATGTNNLTPCNWMLNNESPQRDNGNILNGIESPSPTSIGNHMEILSGKNYTGCLGSQTHTMPSIGNNVRRRTISSTSNGAGTREVHNKLEKNRRAHLKECYEKLKNQLNLKDEDRKKTSNLAVLGEALNQVMALQKQDQELEAKIEQLAKDKINSQKRIVSLKRELGPRYEQIFSGIFPENEITMTSIPNERDNFNKTTSLASARGSTLYSSSNSLSSSGGSTCSNNTTLSSSIGTTAIASTTTHLHTNSSTTIIPVIPKHNTAVKITAANGNNCLGGIATSLLSYNNNNNNNNHHINNNATAAGSAAAAAATTTTTTSLINATVKNNDIFLQNINNKNNSNSKQQATAIVSPTTTQTNILTQQCPTSPSTTAAVGVNNLIISTTAGLSLTAKNISDTSLTRGSPTPSTPSPSPSSSSGVSSSSSFISSSPPVTNGCGSNGVINNGNLNANLTSRQVCINIPNGMKFHVTSGNTYQGTIANGETAVVATTITTGTILRNNKENGNYP